ncbi:hypothetical protein ACROYT_G044115 [Oculina patagonica]
MMVSAIGNVLALRFSEGNHFYAFSTHFPSENEVKNLAQARVKRLYFISPTNISAKALTILKAAGVEVIPMDLLDKEMIKKEVKQTIDRLASKEVGNQISFKEWPKTH